MYTAHCSHFLQDVRCTLLLFEREIRDRESSNSRSNFFFKKNNRKRSIFYHSVLRCIRFTKPFADRKSLSVGFVSFGENCLKRDGIQINCQNFKIQIDTPTVNRVVCQLKPAQNHEMS